MEARRPQVGAGGQVPDSQQSGAHVARWRSVADCLQTPPGTRRARIAPRSSPGTGPIGAYAGKKSLPAGKALIPGGGPPAAARSRPLPQLVRRAVAGPTQPRRGRGEAVDQKCRACCLQTISGRVARSGVCLVGTCVEAVYALWGNPTPCRGPCPRMRGRSRVRAGHRSGSSRLPRALPVSTPYPRPPWMKVFPTSLPATTCAPLSPTSPKR